MYIEKATDDNNMLGVKNHNSCEQDISELEIKKTGFGDSEVEMSN